MDTQHSHFLGLTILGVSGHETINMFSLLMSAGFTADQLKKDGTDPAYIG